MVGEPKLNVFGEHMQASPLRATPEYSPTGGLLGTGFGKTVQTDDPVWDYLAAHPGIKLAMPGNTASVARIKMSPDEVYQYHLARGPALKDMLARAISDPHFTEAPEPIQNQIIKRAMEKTASRVGQIAVMKYRQEHPVTPERIRQALSARGITETGEIEREMSGAPAAEESEQENE